MSGWYPGSNEWEDKGTHLEKTKFNDSGEATDILYARSGSTRKEADKTHIHVGKIGTEDQYINYKDENGQYKDISEELIPQLLGGANPILPDHKLL